MNRKLLIIGAVAGILILAGLPTLTAILTELGAVGLARAIRSEYLTGTAVVVILALLVLLPDWNRVSWRYRITVRQCPVCEHPLGRPGRYCPTCGSRV